MQIRILGCFALSLVVLFSSTAAFARPHKVRVSDPAAAAELKAQGVAYERVGRGEDAKHAYQVAMDLSPKYVKAKLNAARVAKSPVEPDGMNDESMSDVPHPLPEP